MAKEGLSYYSADTDRFNDTRIRRLKRSEYGAIGYVVYEFVLNEIYREKGYYVEDTEDLVLDVAEYWNIDEAQVSAILTYCTEIGLFDKAMYQKEHIFTSRSIQERYAVTVKKLRRIDQETISDNYNLIGKMSEETANPSEEMPNPSAETEKPSAVFDERIRKDNKRKEIKEKSIKEKSATFSSAAADTEPVADIPNTTSENIKLKSGEDVQVDYKRLIEFWNTSTAGSFKPITSINNQRRVLVRARIAEYGKEAFMHTIERAARSDFLRGATFFNFDWMIRPNNFPKVLEGNYDNKPPTIITHSNGNNISNPNNGTYADTPERKPYSRIQELGRTRFNLEEL